MRSWRIRQLDTTASTNDDARQAAEAGEAEGLVIHASKQTAGRGRHGRQWESPEGNLYCSILLRPKIEPRFFGQYSFVASLALAEMIKTFAPHTAVTLKWPNDVLADGKKISGILLESGDGFLIAGMGVNILHHPENAVYPSTSLHVLSAEKFESTSVLEKLLERFFNWHEIMQQQGFVPIRTTWLERVPKGKMTVKLPKEIIEGEFVDIDMEGRLRLKLADGSESAIATGDVFFNNSSFAS